MENTLLCLETDEPHRELARPSLGNDEEYPDEPTPTITKIGTGSNDN